MNDLETIGPGRIPAQLVAHTLFYFTNPGDLVLDPMAGGGVVSDACFIFGRKCLSFDIVTSDNRQEIQYHHWDPQNWKWPITKKPDLIFFDPPYFSKKEKEYEKKAAAETPTISSYTKEEYENSLKRLLPAGPPKRQRNDQDCLPECRLACPPPARSCLAMAGGSLSPKGGGQHRLRLSLRRGGRAGF